MLRLLRASVQRKGDVCGRAQPTIYIIYIYILYILYIYIYIYNRLASQDGGGPWHAVAGWGNLTSPSMAIWLQEAQRVTQASKSGCLRIPVFQPFLFQLPLFPIHFYLQPPWHSAKSKLWACKPEHQVPVCSQIDPKGFEHPR